MLVPGPTVHRTHEGRPTRSVDLPTDDLRESTCDRDRPTDGPSDLANRGAWRVVWIAGPDAGAEVVVAPGRHVVGRSPLASIRCDDAGLEPFHLELDLPAVGGDPALPTWCQLAGRRPVVEVESGLAVGASVLRLEPVSARAASVRPVTTRSVLGGPVVRRPRRAAVTRLGPEGSGDVDATPDGQPLAEPPPGPSGAGVLPALVTLAVGGAVAVALGQPMLALMGAVGALVAICTWAVGAVRAARRRRRHRRAVAAAAVRQAADHEARRSAVAALRRAAHPGLVGACACAAGAPGRLWERRPVHGDAFVAVLGDGPVPVQIGTGARAVLEAAPVLVDLATAARVAVTGAHAGAVVRSLVVQLAVTTGPADWSLLVVTSHPHAWTWATDLPHVHLTSGGQVGHDAAAVAAVVAALSAAPGVGGSPTEPARHLLVLTDDVEEVAVRTSGVRRLLHLRPDAALLVQVADGAPVPAMCTTVAHAATDGGLRVEREDGCQVVERYAAGGQVSGRPDRVVDDDLVLTGRGRLVGIGSRAAAAVAAAIAPWTDPEAPVDEERHLPDDVALESLLATSNGFDRAGIADRWRAAGADPRPGAPLGVAADGVVEIDLVRDGPHALVAGTTGSGKSELLRALVVSLAARVPPDRLAFVLVDFKGGATFDDLVGLPHVVGSVTDLEPRLAERVLRSLRAEVTAREHVLREHGCSDLTAARAALGRPVLPRLVIVVDEFAALALEHPHLLHALVDVARRGRSLGVHLVLATQRPSGVVSDEIRTNTDLRIALRLHEAAEAHDVVGDASPAAIRRSAAGRAVVRLGPGELLAFQSARVVDVGRVVGEIAAAAADLGIAPPRRPWTDPLPSCLGDLPGARSEGRSEARSAGADDRWSGLGLVDRPDEQRLDLLEWEPADGHVLIVGSRGSGVTTALASLVLRRLRGDAEFLVVDATGDARWDDVADHPRCAGIVRLHEHERLERAMSRAATPPPPGGRVVVIDGLGALRRDLEAPARSSAHAAAEALLLGTPPGVTLLLGADGASGLAPAVIARCARRWILHLHDPSEGSAFGVRPASMPPAIPGRMVDAADQCDAQLAPWPEGWRSSTVALSTVEPVRVLPDQVVPRDLVRSSFDGRSWSPVLGLDHASLTARAFEVPLGEHLLVVGPPRSGRSEVASQLRRCWSDARPDAAQVVLAARRVPGRDLASAVVETVDEAARELARGRAVLLVIDDADLVADVDGRLLELVGRRGDDLTVVAACRADAVRSSYGTWLGELRRCRRGIVASAGGDVDADLFGAVLPRHAPVPPRPGLCWFIADGEASLVQVALGR